MFNMFNMFAMFFWGILVRKKHRISIIQKCVKRRVSSTTNMHDESWAICLGGFGHYVKCPAIKNEVALVLAPRAV